MPSSTRRRNSGHSSFFRSVGGYTLLEMLATLVVLMLIMLAVMQFVSDVERSWKSTSVDPFAEAENAFETVAHSLTTATLESYEDYADSNGAFRTDSTTPFIPDHLARRSDLDFVCEPSAGANGLLSNSGRITTGTGVFFLAPQGYTQTCAHTGMERLLNAEGYFVEFGNDDATPSFILSSTPRWRWRLKQVLQPSESLQIYALTSPQAWIQKLVQAGTPVPVLTENIVTMIVLPERAAKDSGQPLATDFRYDSRDENNPLTRNQLPSRLRLALVAMDEASAQVLAARYGSAPPPLVPTNLFHEADQLDADLASLDDALTAQKIGHRIFQRDILLTSAAWSNTPAPTPSP